MQRINDTVARATDGTKVGPPLLFMYTKFQQNLLRISITWVRLRMFFHGDGLTQLLIMQPSKNAYEKNSMYIIWLATESVLIQNSLFSGGVFHCFKMLKILPNLFTHSSSLFISSSLRMKKQTQWPFDGVAKRLKGSGKKPRSIWKRFGRVWKFIERDM